MDNLCKRYKATQRKSYITTTANCTSAKNQKKMANKISSYQYKEIYKEMGIDMKGLYCVMLELEIDETMPQIPKEDQYFDETGKFDWVKGYVAKNGEMHCTLLYGLLDMVKKRHVEEVLRGWDAQIEIEEVTQFDAPDKQEYYCVIGKIKKTEPLVKGHQMLSLLPHINTFLEYQPHVTLAYIKKDDEILSETKKKLKFLEGKRFKIDHITYDNNSGYKKIVNI